MIQPNQVCVWTGTIGEIRAALAGAEPGLSVDERRRAAGFRDPGDRARFELARAALRATLAYCLDCNPQCIAFVAGPNGKPMLAPPSRLHFNISHAHDRVAIAVAVEEVGVDIEYRGRPVDAQALYRRFFASARAGAEAFLDLWVRREAILKASGVGLAGMDSPEPAGWRVELFDIAPDYAAAVAWRGSGPRRIVVNPVADIAKATAEPARL